MSEREPKAIDQKWKVLGYVGMFLLVLSILIVDAVSGVDVDPNTLFWFTAPLMLISILVGVVGSLRISGGMKK